MRLVLLRRNDLRHSALHGAELPDAIVLCGPRFGMKFATVPAEGTSMRTIWDCVLLLMAVPEIALGTQSLARPVQPMGLYAPASQGNKTALAQLTTLANKGNALAQAYLGYMHIHGDGVPRDAVQAAGWFSRAASQGNADAQFNLGAIYYNGDGLQKDAEQAVNWWRKAADQGIVEAQFNLGVMYHNGDGVSRDFVQAAAWYRRAAEQGLAVAQASLGYMYAHGFGVPKDSIKAYMWTNLAAAQGNQEAMKERHAMETSLTPAQLSEALRLGGEWKPRR
jgi:TPR repeat protein